MRDLDNPLEIEFVKEQAEGLGLAGERLRLALVRYRQRLAGSPGAPDEPIEVLLEEAARRATWLMMQREVIGFVRFNTDWIQREFDLPPEVVTRLARETAGWKRGGRDE